MTFMLSRAIVKIVTVALVLGLGSVSFAQETVAETLQDEAVENSAESTTQEDGAYTSYAICAGFYAVMVDEFRAMPQAPDVDYTIEAYLEAGEMSTMLATAFASVDYSADVIEGIVAEAINRETQTLRAMVDDDIQLVGTLYDMICERMIDEAFSVLAG